MANGLGGPLDMPGVRHVPGTARQSRVRIPGLGRARAGVSRAAGTAWSARVEHRPARQKIIFFLNQDIYSRILKK